MYQIRVNVATMVDAKFVSSLIERLSDQQLEGKRSDVVIIPIDLDEEKP